MGGGSSLPYDAEIEYLESTGTQWIDTGIYPTTELSYEITLQRTQSSAGDEVAFGCRKLSYGTNEDFSLWTNPASGKGFASHYAYTPSVAEDSGWVFKNDILSSFRKVHITPQTISVDDVVYYTWSHQERTPFTSTASLGVFCLKLTSVTDSRKFIGRISAVKIWDADNLVFDAIPVRVGQIGYLYDKVSGTLFGNAGTGSFTLGPDKT